MSQTDAGGGASGQVDGRENAAIGPVGADAVTSEPGDRGGMPPKLRGTLTRYKVMAYVTGCMLLLLCLEMFLKYVVDVHGDHSPVLGTWIAIVHGWIYAIYLVTVFLMWSAARWSPGRLAVMVLGGVVPVMSFVVEARAEKWLRAEYPDGGPAGDPPTG